MFRYPDPFRSAACGSPVPCRVAGRYYSLPAPSELHVTVSRHAAQAFTNAPRGTRPLWSVLLVRGSDDGSWHATTPSCPPCPDHLGCARCDDGSDSPLLPIAAVDRRPDIAPLASSRDTRSACDLSASGPVANPI